MLTEKKVLQHFRQLILDSELAKAINGAVYLQGTRPRNSRAEDAIVIFTGGLPGEIEEGIVTYNIYVPDIDPDDDGTYVEDYARTAEIEAMAADWVNSLTADSSYLIRLQETIHTVEEKAIRQHFIVIQLRYRYYD